MGRKEEKDSKKYVLVLEKGKVKAMEIRTGMEGEVNIEITKGLKQGQIVVVEK